MRCARGSRLALAVLGLLGGLAAAQGVPPPTRQDLALLRRATALEPYADSAEAKRNPESLGAFFPRALYPRLLGNPIMGYLLDEGYGSGGETAVRIEKYRCRKGLEAHSPAFRKCVELAFSRAGLRLGAAGRIALGVALVGAVATRSERSLPGVCVEFYLRNCATGKTVFFRRSFGSEESLVRAMVQAAVFMAARAGADD